MVPVGNGWALFLFSGELSLVGSCPRTYSKHLYSVLLPPVIGFTINPALIVHLLNSLACLGSILARRHFRGAHMPHQVRRTALAFYRVPIYTPGWKAAMWIMCLAEGHKFQALTGIESKLQHFDPESRAHPIYHSTSNHECSSLRSYLCLHMACDYE